MTGDLVGRVYQRWQVRAAVALRVAERQTGIAFASSDESAGEFFSPTDYLICDDDVQDQEESCEPSARFAGYSDLPSYEKMETAEEGGPRHHSRRRSHRGAKKKCRRYTRDTLRM